MKRISKKGNVYEYEKEVVATERVVVSSDKLDETIQSLEKVVEDLGLKYEAKKAELDFYKQVKEDILNG